MLNKQDQKQMRKLRRQQRAGKAMIQGVITKNATSPVAVEDVALDIDRLLQQAQRDFGQRQALTGKDRRKLNDWELNTKPSGPGGAWKPDGNRAAVGKCDAQAVRTRNRLKAHGGH